MSHRADRLPRFHGKRLTALRDHARRRLRPELLVAGISEQGRVAARGDHGVEAKVIEKYTNRRSWFIPEASRWP